MILVIVCVIKKLIHNRTPISIAIPHLLWSKQNFYSDCWSEIMRKHWQTTYLRGWRRHRQLYSNILNIWSVVHRTIEWQICDAESKIYQQRLQACMMTMNNEWAWQQCHNRPITPSLWKITGRSKYGCVLQLVEYGTYATTNHCPLVGFVFVLFCCFIFVLFLLVYFFFLTGFSWQLT